MTPFPLQARIAWRFLRSKKSHGAVSAIAMVSVAGMAVATAAIVCVLSVFNGFRSVIAERLDKLSPDLVMVPLEGKTFPAADSLVARISRLPETEVALPVLADNALAIVEGREMPVTLKGVIPSLWSRTVNIDSAVDARDSGRFIKDSDAGASTVAVGVAARIGAFPGSRMLVFAPRRKGKVNMANPAASFISDSLAVTGVFRTDQPAYDENLILTDLATARKIFDRSSDASAIEIRLREGVDPDRAAEKVNALAGKGFDVRTRMRQQAENFRMVEIEKWVSFLLLFFILLTASFNIISTMSMLTLEKREGMLTLRALGLTRSAVARIFFWESIYVAAAGGGAGVILGLILSLAQQHFGFIRLDSGGLDMPYPVVVQGSDILLTLLPVAFIGLLTAFITAAYARSFISRR